MPLALKRVPDTSGPASTVDLPGAAFVTAGALALVWGLVRANSAGWASPEVLGTLVSGTLLIRVFIAWQRRAPAPMLPMRLFGSPSFALRNATSFLLFASNFSTVFFMAQFQQVALGQHPLAAGVRLLPWTAPLFFVGPRDGRRRFRVFTASAEEPLRQLAVVLRLPGAWGHGDGDVDPGSATRWTVDVDRSAERLDTVPETDQPRALSGIGSARAVVSNRELDRAVQLAQGDHARVAPECFEAFVSASATV